MHRWARWLPIEIQNGVSSLENPRWPVSNHSSVRCDPDFRGLQLPSTTPLISTKHYECQLPGLVRYKVSTLALTVCDGRAALFIHARGSVLRTKFTLETQNSCSEKIWNQLRHTNQR